MSEKVPPKITVAIPTRNRPHLLREAINSVIGQSLEDIEILVADNASTDETPEMVAGIDDPRVRLERVEENIGRHANMSRCLHLGSAPYVTVLHDDDIMMPENLARKVEFLERHPSVGFVYSASQGIDLEGQRIEGVLSTDEWSAEHLEGGRSFIRRSMRHGVIPSTPALVFRRSAVVAEEFTEADGPHCDSALCLRIARAHDVGYVPETLTAFRFHSGSLSSGSDGITRYTRSGRPRTTRSFVEAVGLAHGRFLALHYQDAPDAPELTAALATYMRRARIRTAVGRVLPTRVVDLLKRVRAALRGSADASGQARQRP